MIHYYNLKSMPALYCSRILDILHKKSLSQTWRKEVSEPEWEVLEADPIVPIVILI